MSATLNIIETTTELGLEVVEVVVADSSTPGPAGPGVASGGTAGQVLTKDSGTDFDTSWQDPAGGGALDDLSDVTLTSPQTGDRLEFDGAEWVNTASAAVGPHHTSHENGGTDEIDVTGLSGVLADPQTPDTHVHAGEDITSGTVADARIASTIARDSEVTSAISTAEATAQAALDAHTGDTSAAHAASAISASSATLSGTGTDVQAVLEELDNLLDDHSARHENGGADEISVAGLSGKLADAQNVAVKDAGSTVGTRAGINFIEGSNVTLTINDDAGNDEVDVTIASSGGGSAAADEENLILHMEVFA